jgi:LysM repeat protein
MGQLEKYGLYVLCLVIFLILGVAIWGDPEVQRPSVSGSTSNAALMSGAGAAGPQGPPASGDRLRNINDLIDEGGGGRTGATNPGSGQANPGSGQANPGGGQAAPAPGPESGRGSLPQPRAQHKVVSGDSFDSIARQLGSSRLVAELQRLNPDVKPSRMQLGTMLDLPTKAEIDAILGKATNSATGQPAVTPSNERNPAAGAAGSNGSAAPLADGKRSYKVTRGDTLEGIARRELGNPRRVDEIRKLNPSVDPLSLKIGHTLTLPAK